MKFIVVLLTVLNCTVLIYAQQECLTPPNMADPRQCCAIPHTTSHREVFAKCMQKHPIPMVAAPAGGPPPGANCLAECVLEEQGLLSNGIISKDVALSHLLAEVGSSADWQTVARNSVEACYSQVSALGTQKDANGCSSIAGAFMECLPTTLFKKCPTSSWTASPECEQQKAHLEKGCSLMSLIKKPGM
ncbi:general odorant-binding protein 67-like [Toxorhynchites rutilus septentrionalis]|uniref:general odorant-binding protein 67-like n=1 Tax=Toxorhynchites rutilus septentrionalis TaxID=329112 RepID=UPI00247A5B54|nr:general odorant-binding protein 67-like [Toxorhynchites rutilus septentrionalis]XP_055630206.1 general odorant-binding protein 67-like [Toxorhynchites rutilus septentrionalis]